MSEHKEEGKHCPNCGFATSHNYCAQCGQPTHLHKETFFGLIFHFIAHYFHYDSKFWQTIKMLLTKPGKLTMAYWEEKRMRHIPPVSLYILISAVYFLISAVVPDEGPGFRTSVRQPGQPVLRIDTGAAEIQGVTSHSVLDTGALAPSDDSLGSLGIWVKHKAEAIKKKHGDTGKYIKESFQHNMPKIFFFMIPWLAFTLRMLYLRRQDLYFVDHSIFSLHYHAFWFALLTVVELLPSHGWWQILEFIAYLVAFIYLMIALHRVYGTSKIWSFFVGLFIVMSYGFFMGICIVGYFFLLIALG